MLSPEDLEQVVQRLLTQKAAGSSPTATYGHGPGGAFSSFGLSKPVFSSLILPYLGLGGMLPAVSSIDTNPLWGIMTGVTAATGTNPSGVCDECKTSGNMKLCTHSLPFGHYCLDTKVYQVDRIGERRNRAEFMDLTLLNQAFGMNTSNPLMPGPVGGGDPLNNEFNKAMFEFAVSWGLLYASQLFAGNPSNNTAGGGYKEFIGLDLQINVGHVDAETNVACAGADSIIKSMANLDVASNGTTYVRQIASIMRNLKYIASRTGSNPVRWVIAMRWGLFYELSNIWPCSYMTSACSLPSGNSSTIDAQAAIDMRDQMRGDYSAMTGQYLLIDGEKVQVVIDDGIVETQNAGSSFNSSIYFIPITITGGVPVTYWEYFNFDGATAIDEIQKMAPDGSFFSADAGRFLWHRKPPSNWCVEMTALTKPRVMLKTPYLAARMTNVRYTPLAHERDWTVGASYYADGGREGRDFYGPSYYAPVP